MTRNRLKIFAIIAGACIVLGISLFIFVTVHKPEDHCELRLGSACVALERADTLEKRELGLSGRDNLPDDEGMLFMFDQSERACMWMKDMKFDIDIVWLNSDKMITKIEKSVKPETYPNSFCANNTKYVLELNPGIAGRTGLHVGQQLSF